MTFLLRMITAAVLFFSLAAAAPAAVVQADSVRVLPISGDIDGSQAAFIQRGLRQAAEEGDTAVVITINTLGGRVDSALKIRDMLMASDVPTIAYVTSRAWSAGALIALSCRHIIMAPGSSIGAAEPIPNTEKNIAALKAEFSATAAQNGHNPGVAEAMVDKSQGYPDYAEPGKILALSDGQAKELNVSDGSADTLSEALALYSLGDAPLTYVDKDWRDDVVGILQNPYVRTIFVALIIAALLAEIKMAGIGAGIATAFVFGGLLLLSGNESLADGLKIVAAFLVSLLCIGLELASPGVGIFGLAGVEANAPIAELPIVAIFFVLVVMGTVMLTQGVRKVAIHTTRRSVGGGNTYGMQQTFMPLRVNYTGVMPIIFAQPLIQIPSAVIMRFFKGSESAFGQSLYSFAERLGDSASLLHMVVYAALIMFFAFFWVATQFNAVDISENLKKDGSYVPGIRPGRATAEYLDDMMTKITLIGGTGLLIVALIPMVLMGWMTIPWSIASFFGGTSLLIIVGVALDTLRIMESHLLVRKYDGFLSHGTLRGRGGV